MPPHAGFHVFYAKIHLYLVHGEIDKRAVGSG